MSLTRRTFLQQATSLSAGAALVQMVLAEREMEQLRSSADVLRRMLDEAGF